MTERGRDALGVQRADRNQDPDARAAQADELCGDAPRELGDLVALAPDGRVALARKADGVGPRVEEPHGEAGPKEGRDHDRGHDVLERNGEAELVRQEDERRDEVQHARDEDERHETLADLGQDCQAGDEAGHDGSILLRVGLEAWLDAARSGVLGEGRCTEAREAGLSERRSSWWGAVWASRGQSNE